MHSDLALTRMSSQVKDGVLMLSGYGIRVAVERRHLVVSDGIGRERRWGRFSKATCGLKRLVVLGHTGAITLEALRWLNDIGSGFVQIDADGQVIAATCPVGLDDARLRRAQALATSNGTGLGIARELVREKLHGQLALLARLPGSSQATDIVRQAIEKLDQAENLDRLRLIESAAAAAYWGAWRSVPGRFARRDEARLPYHWRTFGSRSSPLTGSSRSAANPANAILNYLYAMLEAEARIAALAMGLDPGLGIYHADQRNRDSLACDLMEPVRPHIDEFVLDLLASHTFAAADFHERREGMCRILPPLTRLLAETALRWAKAVGPIAEQVAQTLLDEADGYTPKRGRLPTPLTQATRSAGRDRVRRKARQPAQRQPLNLPHACRSCGTLLDASDRIYCDGCLPDQRREQAASFIAEGPETLARFRAVGRDPAHGGKAARKRGARNIKNMREALQWEREHKVEHELADFKRDVLPRLQRVSLGAMAKATGLSLGYCSMIRRGLYVPHPRHWKALKVISGGR